MKTLYKTFIGILLIAASTSAQSQYYFSTFNAPYQALPNPVKPLSERPNLGG